MIRYSILFLAFIYTSLSFAQPVDQVTAEEIAKGLLIPAGKTGDDSEFYLYKKEVVEVQQGASTEQINSMYIFQNGEAGFALISADERVLPILGYSFDGNLSLEADLPESFQKLVKEYNQGIRKAVEQNMQASSFTKNKWAKYKGGDFSVQKDDVVEPLLTTKWSQRPNYNLYSPEGAPTGCVATAVAQIMKYHNFPPTGKGYRSYNHETYGKTSVNFDNSTYNWDNMPDKLYNNSTQEEKEAVSKLMYDIGVSIDMNFSPSSSGAFTFDVPYAMKKYFSYSSTVKLKYKNNYTDSQWSALIKDELDDDRVVYHSGFCPDPQAGHAFVIDGYNDDGQFHVNWGWSGSYNGYFEITDLNPGSTYSFNENQKAIVGIKPGFIPNNIPRLSARLSIRDIGNTNTTGVAVTNFDAVYTRDYTSPFNLVTRVKNTGSSTLTADYHLVLIDENGAVLDTLETIGNLSISSNQAKKLSFLDLSISDVFEKEYQLALYYGNSQSNGLVKQYSYQNPINIEHELPEGVLTDYSNLVPFLEADVPSKVELGENFTCKLTVVNQLPYNFTGIISVDLEEFGGDWLAELDQSNVVSISENNTKQITFNIDGLDYDLGAYQLAFWYKEANGNWMRMDDGFYPATQPFDIVITDFSNLGDYYEFNDDQNSAQNIELDFFNQQAEVFIDDADIHFNGDIDNYAINLEPGFDYTFKVQVFDIYNNPTQYTNDVAFKGYLNGTQVVDLVDGTEMLPITVSGGGVFNIEMKSFYAGNKGTYGFKIEASKTEAVTSVNDIITTAFNMFPNPSKGILNVTEIPNDVNSLEVLNAAGQVVYSNEVVNTLNNVLDLNHLSEGTYVLRLLATNAVAQQSFTLIK